MSDQTKQPDLAETIYRLVIDAQRDERSMIDAITTALRSDPGLRQVEDMMLEIMAYTDPCEDRAYVIAEAALATLRRILGEEEG